MTAQPKAPASFDEVFDLLASELNSAYTKAVFFDHLFENENLPTLDAVAPGFFSTVQEILFDDLVLTVARLTDPSSTLGTSNLTLSRLVEMVDPGQFPQVRLQTDFELCRLKACGDALRRHRNKRIAHSDLQTLRNSGGPAESPGELFGQTSLPLIGLVSITDTLAIAERVMSAISEHYKATPFKLCQSDYVTEAVPTLVELLRHATSQPRTAGAPQQ